MVTRGEILPKLQQKESTEDLQDFAGKSFLVFEESCSTAEYIFSNGLNKGLKGLWITRSDPAEKSRRFKGDCEVLWLSTVETEGFVNIDSLEELQKKVQSHILQRKSIIAVDRLDYMVNRYGFSSVLNTLYSISDMVISSKNILLICVNKLTLSKENLAQLESEFSKLPVPEHSKIFMTRFDLYELLKFVRDNKGTNSKQVHKALGITRTTARKRLYDLRDLGFINILKNGRTNYVELTEKGLGCLLG